MAYGAITLMIKAVHEYGECGLEKWIIGIFIGG
jgi:hypothetical protein